MNWNRHTLRVLAGLLVAALPACATTPTQQQGGSTAILMQGFHWNSSGYSSPDWYVTLANNAADMKSLGVTHVCFPTPSDAGITQVYLPRQLNDFNSSYGSQTDQQNAINAFSAQGIKVVVDVVINHRVGTTHDSDFTNPTWTTASIVSNDECNCGAGQPDTGEGYGAARDLDHTDNQVTSGIPTWMNLLKNLGFTGIRYDYSLGYRGAIQATYTNAFAPDLCVGEVWPSSFSLSNVNAHRQVLMNYISRDGASCTNSSDPTCGGGNGGSCGTFDFTTHGLLVEALTNNDYNVLRDSSGTDPAGAIGWWPAMEVTFVDNHDTGPAENCTTGQNLWPVPCGSVMQGYAYILSHPGIPTIFYPHIYNWGLRAPILALVNARRAAGVNSTSAVSIQAAQTGLYAAIVTGTVHQLAVKIGPNSWSPSGAGWTLQTSGTNYAVWMN